MLQTIDSKNRRSLWNSTNPQAEKNRIILTIEFIHKNSNNTTKVEINFQFYKICYTRRNSSIKIKLNRRIRPLYQSSNILHIKLKPFRNVHGSYALLIHHIVSLRNYTMYIETNCWRYEYGDGQPPHLNSKISSDTIRTKMAIHLYADRYGS